MLKIELIRKLFRKELHNPLNVKEIIQDFKIPTGVYPIYDQNFFLKNSASAVKDKDPLTLSMQSG